MCQRHVGLVQCGDHPVVVLDHHPSGQTPGGQGWRGGPDDTGTVPGGHGQRCGRCTGLHLERYLLVQCGRGRGLCLLVVLHRTGVLAHPQVGEPSRRAGQRPLVDLDCLHLRRVAGCALAQPAVHPRHRTGILLPQVPEHQRQGVAHHPAHLVCHHRGHPLWPRAGLRRDGTEVRPAGCQLDGHVVQHWCHHLCLRAHCCPGMEPVGVAQGQERPAHQDLVPGGHRPVGHAPVGRQLVAASAAVHRTVRLSVQVLYAHSAPHPGQYLAQRARHLHRLCQLWRHPHPKQRQHAARRELAQQHLCTGQVSEPRAVWRDAAALWPHGLQPGRLSGPAQRHAPPASQRRPHAICTRGQTEPQRP